MSPLLRKLLILLTPQASEHSAEDFTLMLLAFLSSNPLWSCEGFRSPKFQFIAQ